MFTQVGPRRAGADGVGHRRAGGRAHQAVRHRRPEHPAGAHRRAGQQAVPRPGRPGRRGRHGRQLDRRGRRRTCPTGRRRTPSRAGHGVPAEYGYPPPQFAQDGYSAVKLLAAAIEKAGGTDREKVRGRWRGLTLITPNGTYRYTAADHSGLTTDYISINKVARRPVRADRLVEGRKLANDRWQVAPCTALSRARVERLAGVRRRLRRAGRRPRRRAAASCAAVIGPERRGQVHAVQPDRRAAARRTPAR